MLWFLVSCSSVELVPQQPTSAEAVVLLATASRTAVTVTATVQSTQYVDLDEPTDDRDGFRYQILDAGGEVLYERSTNGPPLVQAFLGYWGDVAGLDVLESLPYLGRFFLHVPLLDQGRTVRFQYRNEQGIYENAGSYDLARVAQDDIGAHPDVIGSTLVHEGGDPAQRFDLVVLPDGYTENQLPRFAQDVDSLAAALFSTPPFDTLAPLINLHRVDVASNEAGAGFDCATCGPRDTAFGSIFAVEAVNRLSGNSFESRAMLQSDQWGVAQAASTVPWDLVLVLTNTDRPSGLAVHAATASTGFAQWEETAVHELGHLIGLLGDEYTGDACIRSERLGLPVNITDRPRNPPWRHWIADGADLPSGIGDIGVGTYAPAYNCPDLYRPRANCLMNAGRNFCPVCQEQLVRRVLRFADPIDRVERRGNRARAVGPLPSRVEWLRDGAVFATSTDDEWVGVGSKPFEVRATLVRDDVRDDPYEDLVFDGFFGD